MLVILYVMDSLRPDFLSCYGHPEDTSPNMDLIASEGVVFENAFAQASWTRPSGASILTSTYPTAHNVMHLDGGRLSGLQTLPEALRAEGFSTVAVTSMVNISSDFGFERGFDRMVELYREPAVRARRPKFDAGDAGRSERFELDKDGVVIPTAEDINDFMFDAIGAHKGRDLFMFAWAIDTHGPYFHRDPSLARFCKPDGRVIWSKLRDKLKSDEDKKYLKGLYRDMVLYNDHHLGVLRERLIRDGMYDDTLLILTADHGEGFGEHGKNGHAGLPYDEQVHVPLIIKFPRGQWAGSRVKGLAQHIDIFPTITGYIGCEGGRTAQGTDLMPMVSGDAAEVNEFVISEVRINRDDPLSLAVRTRDHKYIELRQDEFRAEETLKKTLHKLRRHVKRRLKGLRFLYDLNSDPQEKNNVIGNKEYAHVAERLASAYDDVTVKNLQIAAMREEPGADAGDEDDEVRKQLQALGYMD